MSTEVEALKTKLAEKRSASAKSRKAAHDAEFVEHVYPLLEANEDHEHVEISGAGAGLPGHVVLRPLTLQEFRRVKHVFTKSKDKPGVIEEQSKITEQLARAALVYPTKARFDELLEAHPGVAESCSDKLLARARADQESQEKG